MVKSEGNARLPWSEEDVIVRRARIEPGLGDDDQDEDRAVSPLVGTILLVVIVVLGAVIAAHLVMGGF